MAILIPAFRMQSLKNEDLHGNDKNKLSPKMLVPSWYFDWWLTRDERMCTKGVWQLKTLVLRYCPIGGSSVGAREYIRTGLVEFAKQNPQVECKTILGKGKHPVVEGRYVWGVNKVCDLRRKNPEQIDELVQLLRNTSGHKVTEFKTPIISQTTSIQGRWRPNLTRNVDFSIKTS